MITNLGQFLEKRVKVISQNGSIYFGFISDFFDSSENENGEESVLFEEEHGLLFELYPWSIKSIEVIE